MAQRLGNDEIVVQGIDISPKAFLPESRTDRYVKNLVNDPPAIQVAGTQRQDHFVKGFAEGFGCVGHVFKTPPQTPFKCSLAKQLAQATTATQRNEIVALAKKRIAIKYVGAAMASKLCSIPAATSEGQARRLDEWMIHQDLAAAISKIPPAISKIHG